MLAALTLQGFKAIFDASLSSIGSFTLIIGRNGSGKSSAVEAIQWLRDAMFLGVGSATSGHVGFSDLVNRRSDLLRLDLHYRPPAHRRPVHYVLEVGVPTGAAPPTVRYERCVVGRTSGAYTVVH